MSQDGEWGDEVFLCLAVNVLSLDIVIVAAFRESSFLQGLGITITKSFEKPSVHVLLFQVQLPESSLSECQTKPGRKCPLNIFQFQF